jgi:hypothetical protein
MKAKAKEKEKVAVVSGEKSGGGKVKITKKWLVEKGACSDGMKWFEKEGKPDVYELVGQLKDVNCEWAIWLITRVLDKINNVKFGVFAAEQVLEIYEKQYPLDARPRKAIEVAKAYLENPTEENRTAAACAAYTAAEAADDAAHAAAYAAYAAAVAADYAAADAAYEAARNAAYAAVYAANAAYAAKKEMQLKIIAYGEQLLRANPKLKQEAQK